MVQNGGPPMPTDLSTHGSKGRCGTMKAEHQERIAEANKRTTGSVSLRESHVDRPFVVQLTTEHANTFVMDAIRDLGMEIVGVTHDRDMTEIHVEER